MNKKEELSNIVIEGLLDYCKDKDRSNRFVERILEGNEEFKKMKEEEIEELKIEVEKKLDEMIKNGL